MKGRVLMMLAFSLVTLAEDWQTRKLRGKVGNLSVS
jgi:hypothetical protein